MNNELNKHKTSDSIKWWLTLIAFIVVGVLIAGMIAGWFNPKPNTEEKEESAVAVDTSGEFMYSDTVYAMPKALSFSSTALYSAKANSSDCVSVNIEAYVWPENASNRKVDYSVAWGSAPTYGSNPVSDYVTVSQANDGDTVATVSCYKAFGNDTIILTVTTRDGGYTDTCTISFDGIASSMNISSETLTLSHSSERGNYYLLGTGKTYDFDVIMNNVFNEVGSYNLTATISGVGSVYFGTTFSDSSSGFTNFESAELKEIDGFKDEFISVSIDGTTLSITTDSTYIENYYSHRESDEYGMGTYSYDRFVCLDEYGLIGGSSGFDYAGTAQENQTLLTSCYFTITVSDSISGLSKTINVWAEPSVSGVNLSEDTLGF